MDFYLDLVIWFYALFNAPFVRSFPHLTPRPILNYARAPAWSRANERTKQYPSSSVECSLPRFSYSRRGNIKNVSSEFQILPSCSPNIHNHVE